MDDRDLQRPAPTLYVPVFEARARHFSVPATAIGRPAPTASLHRRAGTALNRTAPRCAVRKA